MPKILNNPICIVHFFHKTQIHQDYTPECLCYTGLTCHTLFSMTSSRLHSTSKDNHLFKIQIPIHDSGRLKPLRSMKILLLASVRPNQAKKADGNISQCPILPRSLLEHTVVPASIYTGSSTEPFPLLQKVQDGNNISYARESNLVRVKNTSITPQGVCHSQKNHNYNLCWIFSG